MASLRWNTIAIAILLTPVAFGSSDPLLPPQVIELNVPKAEGQDNVQRLILEWTELPAGLKTDAEKLRLKDHLVTQGRADLSSIAKLLENGLPDSGLGKGFFARVIGETKDLKGTPLLYNAFENSKEFDEKLEILKGIESLGDPAAISLLLPHLDCGTDGSDILSRQKMADAVELTLQNLANQGDGTQIVVNECTKLMPKASDILKIRMAHVLQAAASKAAEDLLLTMMYENSYIVRCAALVALSQTKSQNRAPARIFEMLRSEDNNERKEAALALGRLAYLPGIPNLIALLDDHDIGVKLNALWALRHISNQNYPRDSLMWKNWWEIEKRDSADKFKFLAEKMKSSSPDEVPVIIEEFGELELMRNDVLRLVSPLIGDTDFKIRAAVCNVLGRMVDPVSIPALISRLQDPQPEVAHTAWRSLKELTGKHLPLSYAAWSNWNHNVR